MQNNTKLVKFSTFIITVISLIVIFTASLIGIVIYYKNKIENQETDLTLIPNVYNNEDNTTNENLTIIE